MVTATYRRNPEDFFGGLLNEQQFLQLQQFQAHHQSMGGGKIDEILMIEGPSGKTKIYSRRSK